VVRTVKEEEFFSALLEEGRKVIAEKFGDDIPFDESTSGDEIISLTPTEASAQLPGRAARRG
jgi:hypothetical protein